MWVGGWLIGIHLANTSKKELKFFFMFYVALEYV